MIKESNFYEDFENDRILKVVNVSKFSCLCVEYPIYWLDDEYSYNVDTDNWNYATVSSSLLKRIP